MALNARPTTNFHDQRVKGQDHSVTIRITLKIIITFRELIAR